MSNLKAGLGRSQPSRRSLNPIRSQFQNTSTISGTVSRQGLRGTEFKFQDTSSFLLIQAKTGATPGFPESPPQIPLSSSSTAEFSRTPQLVCPLRFDICPKKADRDNHNRPFCRIALTNSTVVKCIGFLVPSSPFRPLGPFQSLISNKRKGTKRTERTEVTAR